MSDVVESTSTHGVCYYSVLGITKKATDYEIRGAYRNMALEHPRQVHLFECGSGAASMRIYRAYSQNTFKKQDRTKAGLMCRRGLIYCTWIIMCKPQQKWHPDRWTRDPKVAIEAKRKFQQIQEAYSVLSNKGKRTIYDAGLFGLIGEDDDEGFVDFMQELTLMMQMESSKDEKSRIEDLERLVMEMMASSEGTGKSGFLWDSSTIPTKKIRI